MVGTTFDDDRTRATHRGANREREARNEAVRIGKEGLSGANVTFRGKAAIQLMLPPGNPKSVSWMPRFPACQICAGRLETSAVGRFVGEYGKKSNDGGQRRCA